MLADLGRELSGREAHGRDVEARVVLEAGEVRVHEVERALEAIGHIHHGQAGVLAQETGVAAVLDGLVEDGHGVVGRPAAGQGQVADDAGIAAAADVESVLEDVVVAEELAGDLGDAVDRRRAEDGVLGRHLAGSGRPEDGDGARRENAEEAPGPADLEDVVEPAHVDGPGLLGVLLAGRGEESGQVVDGVGAELPDQGVEGGPVGDVDELEGPGLGQRGRGADDVGDQDVVAAVFLAQGLGQLGADLSGRARHQDSLRLFRHGRPLSPGIEGKTVDIYNTAAAVLKGDGPPRAGASWDQVPSFPGLTPSWTSGKVSGLVMSRDTDHHHRPSEEASPCPLP